MQDNPLLMNIMKKMCEKVILKGPNNCDFQAIQMSLKKKREDNKKEVRKTPRAIEAYFMGPRGQNSNFFRQLIDQAIQSNIIARKSYEMDDSIHITRSMKAQPTFIAAQDSLQKSYNYLLTKLRDLSPPFHSSRYFGHMIWETSIPAMIGYFSTMLYNPNNCAFESSPLTTQLQMDCMKQFAQMFGYSSMISKANSSDGKDHSWGHFTSGGTISNCESIWAARNAKFLGVSLFNYVKSLEHKKFQKVKQITVLLVTKENKKLLELSVWELLNIPNDQVLALKERIFKMIYGSHFNKYEEYEAELSPYTLAQSGLIGIYDAIQQMAELNPDKNWPKNKMPKPLAFCSSTTHYSIQKGLSLVGLGKGSHKAIQVDLDTRINTVKLEQKLNECADKHIPVLIVLAILGSTEESTVDNIEEILAIKQRMAVKGLFFHFHVDGAYGGYFLSMIRKQNKNQFNSFSNFVQRQLKQVHKADSITFDPHKTGYIPYACGGVYYKNHRLRNILSFSAPYIYQGLQQNVSIYGIEGSKAGAAAASVYLSLEVMPLERSGHGELLERALINTRIFTASLYGMKYKQFKYTLINGAKYKERFNCCVLPRSYVQKHQCPQENQIQQEAFKKIAVTNYSEMPNLISDPNVGKYYFELGPDLNIVCFALNFIDKQTGTWNRSLKKLNQFNKTIITISKPVGTDINVQCKDLYVSNAQVGMKYGSPIFQDFIQRHNLIQDDNIIDLIRSTIMNPFFTELNNNQGNEIFISQFAQNGCQALEYLFQKSKK